MNETVRLKGYHHGDLRNALKSAARTILEEEGLAALSLRAVARKAGVSHAAPYRHYPNHEALLVELALEGFSELRVDVVAASASSEPIAERISEIGAAYMRFVAKRPALARLMFGAQLPNRDSYPDLAAAADSLAEELGASLNDPALGLAVWAAAHGLATLALENVIDLGQRRSGLDVLPSRAKMLLRGLVTIPDR